LKNVDREQAAGKWLLLAGAPGALFIGGLTVAATQASGPDARPSEPAFGIGWGGVALSAIAVATGFGLIFGAQPRGERVLREFNQDAATNGCRPAPLP
jgi:hypothetical protein